MVIEKKKNLINDCNNIVYELSNKNYNIQGPITSSARTAALRYCAQDVESRRCYIPTTDYNKFGKTEHNKFPVGYNECINLNNCYNKKGKIRILQ